MVLTGDPKLSLGVNVCSVWPCDRLVICSGCNPLLPSSNRDRLQQLHDTSFENGCLEVDIVAPA